MKKGVKKESKMTLDKLAAMIINLNEETRQEIKGEFSQLEIRLGAKIQRLENRIDVFAGLDRKVETLDKRVTNVEVKVGIKVR